MFPKIRLIGYYSGKKQNMQPEQKMISEAQLLSDLLARTFSLSFLDKETIASIDDQAFIRALSASTVYIFRDKEYNLFAYFPEKNLARLSDIIYDKKTIIKPPSSVKSWFVPGEKILLNYNLELEHKVCLHLINGIVLTYTEKDMAISTIGKDFIISLNSKMFPIDWPDDDYISIKRMKQMIVHPWIYLQEIDTNDLCEDCDGYDYSNCDMSRCHNNCNNCGGRIYICNYGCFNYRYKRCVQIKCYEQKVSAELSKGLSIIKKITSPHSCDNHLLESRILKKIYEDCMLCKKIYFKEIDAFLDEYSLMKKKEHDRQVESKHIIDIHITENNRRIMYRIDLAALNIHKGILWLKSSLVIQGYDFISDDYIDIKFKLSNDKSNKLFIDTFQKGSCPKTIDIKINNDLAYCRFSETD